MGRKVTTAAQARKLAFADAFLGKAKFCVIDAAKLAGFKGSRSVLAASGSRMLRDPVVVARLAQISLKATESASYEARHVVEGLIRHARADMSDFLTEEGQVEPDLERARREGKLHLIKSFKIKRRSYFTEKGGEVVEVTREFKLHDAQGALDKLARIFGLYAKAGDDQGSGALADEQQLVDLMLQHKIPPALWDPGLQRALESRQRKQITSTVVKP